MVQITYEGHTISVEESYIDKSVRHKCGFPCCVGPYNSWEPLLLLWTRHFVPDTFEKFFLKNF